MSLGDGGSTEETAVESAAAEYQEETDKIASEVNEVNDVVDGLIDTGYEKENGKIDGFRNEMNEANDEISSSDNIIINDIETLESINEELKEKSQEIDEATAEIKKARTVAQANENYDKVTELAKEAEASYEEAVKKSKELNEEFEKAQKAVEDAQKRYEEAAEIPTEKKSFPWFILVILGAFGITIEEVTRRQKAKADSRTND